jgi:mannose-1-phosphate guanylyltransferase
VSRVHAVLLAGGRGTRFWPASREALPKQFLRVGGDESLLARTGRRLAGVVAPRDTWVVTNAAHAALAAGHLPGIPRDRIVGEPVGRNTAPCIALAAALVAREDPEGVLLVAPADHWIGDEPAFRHAALAAVEVARATRTLVTFGVVPTSPATGYGYIEAGEPLGGPSADARRVARFTEKPDLATAQRFLASGRHTWNSGIFAWRADVFLEELERVEPAMSAAARRFAEAADLDAALRAEYAALPSISVDYAVLERSARVAVLPARFPWSDVGSWDALAALSPVDGRGNTLSGDVLAVDANGCFVESDGRPTALLGVRDLIVVTRPDAVLIAAKGRSQDVKQLVEQLERQGRVELL